MQAKGLGYWVEVDLYFIRPIALTTEKRIEQKLSPDRDVCIAICIDSFTLSSGRPSPANGSHSTA
jgi:hypothetical protein